MSVAAATSSSDNREHIKTANEIEVRLDDQDLVPRNADFCGAAPECAWYRREPVHGMSSKGAEFWSPGHAPSLVIRRRTERKADAITSHTSARISLAKVSVSQIRAVRTFP